MIANFSKEKFVSKSLSYKIESVTNTNFVFKKGGRGKPDAILFN